MTTAAATELRLTPAAGRIGAVVHDIELSGSLGPETVAAIETALYRHKVLFFRGQRHLDDAGHEAFARLLGHPVGHPTVPSADGRYIFELDATKGVRANNWHTDVTFVPSYPKASILRSLELPEAGGSTVWANTAAAYDDLPAPLKVLAESLRAVHTNDYDYAATLALTPELAENREIAALFRQVFVSTAFKTEHPVVRVHPVTGEKSLLLGAFAQRVQGVSGADSRALLELFQRYVERLENTVRWDWQVGDVVIWDNRATQHYAVNDYGDQPRLVRRITLDGDLPVGVDGTPSRLIEPTEPPAVAGLVPAEQLEAAALSG
ncbi:MULTISPECIES: TauD/TfdA family dioxygenase [unclassified Kitasatospora]|uniref:TauD/TfdA dioxygenase family protein n=1 Tax=unclassified Kitasatospora TaxID=2633591 RepID=UPI00070AC33E|nr:MULTISPECIES: TauD/TfdA family dioxygenase [unclassified Kitasatospora]KQV20552.1 taurine dioxygenase [Kitasatospora sp. Root107]KRB69117.1 taurine dioxygenase [Kitasatospora sp. Root187]